MSQDSKPGFEIPCECGHKVYSLPRESKCPQCGRLLVISWPTAPAKEPGK
jgi:hypothetical protein